MFLCELFNNSFNFVAIIRNTASRLIYQQAYLKEEGKKFINTQ